MNGNTKRQNSIVADILTVAVAAGACTLAAKSALLFVALIAAAATSYLAEARKNYPLVALTAVISAAGAYLVSGSIITAAVNVASIAIVSAVMILCKRLDAGFFRASVALGIVTAVITAGALAISIASVYGNVVSGAKQMASEIYHTVFENLKLIADNGDGTLLIAENELEALLSTAVTLLPGIAAFIFQVTGGISYMIFKTVYKIFGLRAGRREGEYNVPRSAIIFFAFSVVLALVFSMIKSLEVAYLAALNICIALSAPTFFDGVSRIVNGFRHPKIIVMPDGSTMKRLPVFIIAALVLSLLFSILFTGIILLGYSVAGTLKDMVTEASKRKDE